MLLDLCHAYTKAINQGQVPNINSAWSNLCKNENQRAIQQAISNYTKCLEKQCLSVDPITKKEQFIHDLVKIKSLNKTIKSDVIDTF